MRFPSGCPARRPRHDPAQQQALGRELGLDDPELDLLGYVAGIHDVGMLPFLESVAAPGSLDPDRREWLTRHPEVSVEIIRPLEYMQRVKELILTHHERWDGAGYPLGLAGETIPLGSRILAVVDAYVSMIKDRPYRAAAARRRRSPSCVSPPAPSSIREVVDAFAAVLAPRGRMKRKEYSGPSVVELKLRPSSTVSAAS